MFPLFCLLLTVNTNRTGMRFFYTLFQHLLHLKLYLKASCQSVLDTGFLFFSLPLLFLFKEETSSVS